MSAPGKLILVFLCVFAIKAADDSFFTDKVQPILESRCYECHSHKSGKMKGGLTLDSRSGWQGGGEQGPVIIPGDPEKSLLVKAIQRTDPDLKMPPKNPLPESEISILVEWIRTGAHDPRQEVGVKHDTNWWSLKPLVKPALPRVADNPIDSFLKPDGPEANRRTLIRRLHFDLHGLPPSFEEVKSFQNDSDPRAYEKLVDRLLDSPRYGERWARHWLDAIHFADTHGFEHDLIRTNAWPYRDYVIDRLNRDIPWPRFIREQLATDVFYPDEPQLTPALGFIGAGPWDQSTAQTAPITFDYLDRDDMVTQTMSTFASVTVHCARCHDHKFDPIPQVDYYALQAVFAGVGKGDISFDRDLEIARSRKHWKNILVAAEKNDPSVLLTETNSALIAEWERAFSVPASWHTIVPDTFLTTSASVLKRLDDGSLIAQGPRPEIDTYTITTSTPRDITAIRLEVFSDPAFPKNGPGRTDNGNLHLSEVELQLFAPGADKPHKLKISRASADFNQEGWTIAHAIDGNDKTAWGIYPRVGENHSAVFEVAERLLLTNGARLAIQLKQLHGGSHLIGKFRISSTADDPANARILPTNLIAALKSKSRNETQRLAVAAYALREIAEKKLSQLPAPSVAFGAASEFKYIGDYPYKPWAEPKVVHVLKRGDINKPGATAMAGSLSALSVSYSARDSRESSRRAALADWLAHEQNPLTWRSIVNRVWHHHFGLGIVDSLNDFGRMGGQPSHPELLDWLACEFRDNGGSLKSLHRLILTSRTYRSEHRIQRLDAESFHDAVLAVSGCLDLTMGGPAVQHFKLGKPIQITPTVDYDNFDWSAQGANRRSIYRFVYRGIQDPFMEAVDFPDAAQLAPTRPFSASALQSLALMNNDFVLYHSDVFAKKAKDVKTAFRLAFQRDPSDVELHDFSAYAEKHGLAATCRLLFNSNEFLFVN